jgi:hypothetical protein
MTNHRNWGPENAHNPGFSPPRYDVRPNGYTKIIYDNFGYPTRVVTDWFDNTFMPWYDNASPGDQWTFWNFCMETGGPPI